MTLVVVPVATVLLTNEFTRQFRIISNQEQKKPPIGQLFEKRKIYWV